MSDQSERIATIRLLVSEQSAEIRSRRDPEHLLTAALLGALGAVAWGVSTLSSIPTKHGIVHPAIAGAISAIVMTVAVSAKVIREHLKYRNLREKQIKLMTLLAEASKIEQEALPSEVRSTASIKGSGVWWSLGGSWASMIAIVLFCLTIWQNALPK